MEWEGLVSAVLVVITLWVGLELWRQLMTRGRNLGPICWPLVGSLVEILLNYHRLNDWNTSYLEKSPGTTMTKLPHATFICTVLPENVAHILKTNFSNYVKGKQFHEAMDIFLGDGIFNVDGDLWLKQRKTASFEFSSKVLREFSTLVYRDFSLKLAAILNHAATAQKVVDMQDLFMRLTLDSICKISFGIEIRGLEPSLPCIPFAKAFETTNEIVSYRIADPFWKIKRFFKVGTEATVVKSAKQIDDFVYNLIRTRRTELAALRKSGEATNDSLVQRKDLFTRFLLLNEEGEGSYTDKNFRDTILNFVIAGRDTTAVTLSWFMYMMIQHPEVEQKIEEELGRAFVKERKKKEEDEVEEEVEEDEVALSLNSVGIDDEERIAAAAATALQQDDGRSFAAADENLNNLGQIAEYSQQLNSESLAKLQYLYAAILETLRLYPAVPLDPKFALNDDVLPDGTQVKKGDTVFYAAYAMGRMKYNWGSDACEFKPERWLKDGVVQLESPFKFTAFQAGPRMCLGKDSAILQLRMTLAILCMFYKFQLATEAPVRYRQMSTLILANGLPVIVKRKL